MVVDRHGRSHRPKGLPRRQAGTYESSAGAGDDDLEEAVESEEDRLRRLVAEGAQGEPGNEWDMDVDRVLLERGSNARRRHYYEYMDSTRPGWAFDESRLKATKVGGDADRTGWSVVSPAEEIDIIETACADGTDERHPGYGPVVRAFLPWFPNVSEAREMADMWVDTTVLAMRRSCASDPTLCYSRGMLAKKLLASPIRVERILAREPWRMSAHRMRAGRAYLDRLNAYRQKHGNLPPEEERDRMWDEDLSKYIESKRDKRKPDGYKAVGRGLTYSDGRTADPHAKDKKRVRMTKDGTPFNGREDFENMLSSGRQALGLMRRPVDSSDERRAGVESNVTEENAYRLALREGYSEKQLAELRKRFGIDPKRADELAARWEV